MGNEINSLSVLLHAIRLKFKEMFKPDDFVSEANIDSDPFQQFSKWYNKAVRSRIPFYEAMNLSTADTDGKPSSRMVLLKAFNKDGFVFYTNSNSRKGKEISGNPYVSVTFYWNKLGRQIRIEGIIEGISEKESDDYFASRPRGSQLGAWASHQSSIIADRNTLIEEVKNLENQYKGKPVPRPPYWIGYRIVPQTFEFWQNRISRLHDRFKYTLDENNNWKHLRLAP